MKLLKQKLTLLARRDGGTWAPYWQYLVALAWIRQTPSNEIAQIIIADRLASSQLAIPKNQKWFAFFDALQLTRK